MPDSVALCNGPFVCPLAARTVSSEKSCLARPPGDVGKLSHQRLQVLPHAPPSPLPLTKKTHNLRKLHPEALPHPAQTLETPVIARCPPVSLGNQAS